MLEVVVSYPPELFSFVDSAYDSSSSVAFRTYTILCEKGIQ